nr:MAG TPA: hypothetical protein [Caudoviricetes sp.]
MSSAVWLQYGHLKSLGIFSPHFLIKFRYCRTDNLIIKKEMKNVENN